MIIKNTNELEVLKKSGAICKKVLEEGINEVKPGVSTYFIDSYLERRIKELGGTPSFLGYDAGGGPYPFSSCISINHQLVHTLPSKNVLVKKGDLVTIDVGVVYKGINTDTAYTVEVNSKKQTFFLNTGKKALKKAVNQAIVGNKIGDISFFMEDTALKAGFNVSYDLVGHGIGYKLHEPPQIPCYGRKHSGERLNENQVLAIEIMYMQGENTLALGKDGFSFDTKDKSLSAQFEHTVVVSKNKPIIIV